jgi:hypothetical protein
MRVREAWPTLSVLLAVLLLTSLPSVHAKRALRQSDAFSNSNGCFDGIPKCELGACATRNIMGTASWVCLRCRGNYEPVVDSSGQDNIIQCGKMLLQSHVLLLRLGTCGLVCQCLWLLLCELCSDLIPRAALGPDLPFPAVCSVSAWVLRACC